MTGSEVLLALNAIAQLLFKGDYSTIARQFETPLPVYIPNEFTLLRKQVWVERVLACYHAKLTEDGVTRAKPVLLEVEDHTDFRSLVLIRWDFLNADGACVSSNTARYVLRRDEAYGKLRVELIEYLEMSFPGFPKCLFDVLDPPGRLVEPVGLA